MLKRLEEVSRMALAIVICVSAGFVSTLSLLLLADSSALVRPKRRRSGGKGYEQESCRDMCAMYTGW